MKLTRDELNMIAEAYNYSPLLGQEAKDKIQLYSIMSRARKFNKGSINSNMFSELDEEILYLAAKILTALEDAGKGFYFSDSNEEKQSVMKNWLAQAWSEYFSVNERHFSDVLKVIGYPG